MTIRMFAILHHIAMATEWDRTYVDLFCGAGGLSLGFDRAGFHNIFSVDNEPTFCATYRHNFPAHHLIETDIAALSPAKIRKALAGRAVDVVVGGPPCQGFSIAGHIGRRFVDDPRNHLFREFARVVSIIKPSYFVMENVARLYTHNKGATRAEMIDTFQSLGYAVSCAVLNAAEYGVPQYRRRVFFLGTKQSEPLTFPDPIPNRISTVLEAIGDLPPLASGERSSIPNHEAMNHSERMLTRMSFIKDGGDRSEIPSPLRPRSGDSRKYIRYNSNEPSVCVTGDMRKIFHYRDNRALTVRELARLQTFPDTFVFKGSRISQQQQVGNAVPPILAEHIARIIRNAITHEAHLPKGKFHRQQRESRVMDLRSVPE